MRKIYFLLLAIAFAAVSNAQNVNVAGAVGGNGSYPDLGSAFTAINGGAQTGANITVSIVGNTTETVSAALNAGAWTSLVITPSGGASRTISGSLAGPLIDLNGADNVTINGLNTGGNSLAISNASTSGLTNTSTIRFINDASGNLVTNCTISGASTSVTLGTVLFSTGTATGNDNNTISNSSINGAGATFPVNAVFSAGTATFENSGNTISGCNVSDYFSATLLTSGILVGANNTGWTISNNRLFQSASRTYTAANIHNGISISSGNGHIVSGNTIGFATAAGTGVYTMTSTLAARFIAINLAVGTTAATSVQGNTIAGISLGTSSGATTTNGILCGINITGGNVNVGNITPNTIGSTTGTGSLVATPTTTQGTIVGIHSSSTGTLLIENNLIGGFTSTGATAGVAGGVAGISVSGASASMTINGNTVGNSTVDNMRAGTLATTTGSSIATGISVTATPVILSVTNNTVQNFASYGTGTGGFVRGIIGSTAVNTTATYNISNNVITNLTTSGAAVGYSSGLTCAQGIQFSGGLNGTCIQNTISNISAINNTATTNIVVSGIASASGLGNIISRNRIWGLSNAGIGTTATAPPIIAGIIVRSGTTSVHVNNNMISLGAGQTTNTTILGIMLNHGSTPDPVNNIFFNTINISGTVGAGALITSCLTRGDLTATSRNQVSDIRNNILENTRTGGTGAHYAISNNPNATSSVTGWSSNFNVLNAAPATVGFWTTGQTFAGWQTASVSDVNSFSGVTVNFVNTATADLHISGISPAIEGTGVAIASVTVDYDNQVRSALTPTDIGADAGNFINYPTIAYTPLPATCATGARTLTATITDVDGVPTAGIGLPVLYWRINAGAYVAATATSLGGDQYQFSLGGGAVIGDVVSYYIVAQDNLGNVGASPSSGAGAFTINPPAAGTPPSAPSSYTLLNTLSGTYTVGAGGNFTTLTAAVNAYNTNCIGGPIVFSLTDATYTSETYPITINNNAAASAVNTLTVRPATGIAATISGNHGTALIKLNGADYVTIDGINAGGSSLTIQNTNAANTSTVLWITSVLTDGATNNTIRNCTVTGNTGSTTISCILAGDGVTLGNAATAANSNNTIQGNILKAAQNGIYISGIATTFDQNWLIDNNVIGSTLVANDKMIFRGMALISVNDFIVRNNTINGVVSTPASTAVMTGISIFTGATNGAVTGNKISDIKQTNSGTPTGANGIGLFAPTLSSNITIANNFISDIAGFGSATSASNGHGIIVSAGSGYNIYYNTINLNTNQSAVTGIPAAINITSGITAAGAVNLRNNIFTNTQTTGTNRYAIYSGAANTVFAAIDNNDYYSTGPNLGFIGSNRVDIAAIQAGFGGNTSSVSVLPVFMTPTDLHLNPGFNPGLNNLGVTIAGITTDIDGDTRGASPDMGADEFTPCTPPTTATASSNSPVCEGGTLNLTGTTDGNGYSWTGPNGFSSSLQNPSIPSVTAAAAGVYYFQGFLAGCPSLASPTTVVINSSPVITGVTATPATVCLNANSQLQVTTSTNAVNLYSRVPLTGQTYTQLTGGGITVINQNSGLSASMSTNQDDGAVLITLPFSFTYFGNSFNQMTMCTNGWVGAGNQLAVDAANGRTAGNLYTTTIPNNTIAAWFKDMGANFPIAQPGTGPGTMRHGLTGTDVYSFQWDNAVGNSFNITTVDLISFQVNIYGPASTSPGRIELIYGPTAGTTAFAAGIGIEDAVGGSDRYINALTGTGTSAATSSAWPGNGNGYQFNPITLTYLWSPSTFLSSTTIANPVATAVTATTAYTVAVSGPNGCSTNGNVTVTVDTDAFNVTGGGAICAGGLGTPVGLDGSQTGVNYQLQIGAVNTGAPVAGTGAAISFGNQTVAGTYTVVATHATSFCTRTMTGSAIITVDPAPAQFIVTGGGAYCTGGAGAVVGLSGSETGVNYQLQLNGSDIGSPVAGTGAAISFGLQTGSGTYTVIATNTTTLCTSTMTGSVVVSVDPLPTPFNVTGSGVYCGVGGVPVGLDGSETGVNYQLFAGAVPVGAPVPGTGGAISFGSQLTGTYTVVATNTSTTCTNNMSGSAIVSTTIAPVVNAPTVTQPTIVTPTGTIVVNATGGPTLEYSINGAAGPYQISNTFTGLAPGGSYNIAVRLQNTSGCVTLYSGNPVILSTISSRITDVLVGASPFQDSMWTINLADYSIIRRIGPTPSSGGSITGITALATNPLTGEHFAMLKQSAVSGRVLAKINVQTGLATIIGNTGGNFSSLTFTSAGNLYGMIGDGGSSGGFIPEAMYAIDTNTAASTHFRTLGNGQDGEVITFNPDDNLFYHWSGNGTVVWERFGTAVDPIQPLTTPQNGEVFGALYAGIGKIWVSNISSTIRLWDIPTQTAGPVLMSTPDDLRGLVRESCASSLAAGGSTAICSGGSVVLSVIGGTGNYQWYLNGVAIGGETSPAYTATGAGIYNAIYTDGCGVTDSVSLGITVTFNPTPDAVATPSSQTICSGAAITTIALTGAVPATTYSWTRDNTGSVTGIAANGAGDISGVLTNTTTAPVTVTFTITPTANGCTGTAITATVLVNPTPDAVATPSSQTICSGATITTIVVSGAVAATTFNWTRDNTVAVTGIAAGGSGDISGALTNTTNAPVTVTFTITPTANGCPGTPITATVLVNPTPDAVATPASQTVCSANPITTIVVSGAVAGTTYNWTRDNTVAVTGIAASGAGNISGTLTNTTNAPVTVTFTITPTANGCPGAAITATVLVNPTPNAVATPASQTICSAGTITPIVLSGAVAGTTFNWTRDNTVAVTGIAASGSGNISGTLTNTTTAPVTVTFTITPTANGCPGTPITATVLVNPTPNAVATPASQTICSATPITTIVLSGAVTGTTYSWIRNNTVAVTGIAASGTGSISGTLTNTTNAPVTVTFTITPTANGCTGPAITATVLVNPTPTVAVGTMQVIITGDGNWADEITWTLTNSIGGVILTGGPYGFNPGATASATVPANNAPFSFFIEAQGAFNDNSCLWEVRCNGVAVASGCIRGTASTSTCASTGTLTVPNISGCGSNLAAQTICSGSAITPITLSGPVAGTVFNWTRNNTVAVTGIAASGTGNISGTLTNTTNAPVVVTFTITPTANGCNGPAVNVNVTVNPIPNAIATPSTQTICSGPITTIVLTSAVAGTTYAWTRDNLVNATGIAASGTGNITGSLTNTTLVQQTVTFTITPTANGCTGTPITATVILNVAPTITCPANITVPSVVGGCTAVVTYAPTSTGSPAPAITYSLSGATTGSGSGTGSGLAFNVGVTTVTLTATNSCGTVTCSFTVTVTDSQLPVISAQPVNRTVCAGATATFSVTAATAPSAGGPIAYQWQQWNGTAWVNIAGATTATLTVSNTTVSMNTNTYRVQLTGLCSIVNSNAATLFVNPVPTVTVSANPPASILPNQTTTLTATANPAGGTYQWSYNGTAIPGATGASLGPIGVDELGSYRVTYTSPAGCTATSADFQVTGAISDVLWVYPNPNRGIFQVRFFNQSNEPATVMVFNAGGQKVYEQKVVTGGTTYSQIQVDLGLKANGVYIVQLVNGNGKVLGAKRIIVQVF